MTTQTIDLATNGFAHDPDYSRGRADAYDASRTRTNDQMTVLAGMAADHATLPYALGFMDRVIELRLEQDAVAGAETELAWTDQPART
ncbi:hypothetical protein ACIQVL_48630 [Streptomyces sp. NPDC090499]|uniref:hypothetical protein n=1 Tax=Streptomyces sp. NPDC090499 TaxID=3365965 RepID=UPI00381592C2